MKTIFNSIFILGFSFVALSQNEYKKISGKLFTVDSILILNYRLFDSINEIRKNIKEGNIDSNIKKAALLLGIKSRKELASILLKENHFAGRYASQRGFYPEQVILLLNNGQYSYLEFCLNCHDIFASPDFEFDWLHIDPIKADELYDLFRKLGVIKRPEKIKLNIN